MQNPCQTISFEALSEQSSRGVGEGLRGAWESPGARSCFVLLGSTLHRRYPDLPAASWSATPAPVKPASLPADWRPGRGRPQSAPRAGAKPKWLTSRGHRGLCSARLWARRGGARRIPGSALLFSVDGAGPAARCVQQDVLTSRRAGSRAGAAGARLCVGRRREAASQARRSRLCGVLGRRPPQQSRPGQSGPRWP
jgi:hypothetical protein